MALPTIAEVSALLLRPKSMVADMTWVARPNAKAREWMAFRSAVRFSDEAEIPEGLLVTGGWRCAVAASPERWNFSVIWIGERVYGIDVEPHTIHRNAVGRGRRLFDQRIRGTHEHTWSTEGGGYAEPMSLTVDEAWSRFVGTTTLIDATFVHPDDHIAQGQGSLLP